MCNYNRTLMSLIIVIGAGSGGTAIVNKICNHFKALKVAILDPSEIHYYQPGWTLVGAGITLFEQTQSSTSNNIPNQAIWIKQKAVKLMPEKNQLMTADHSLIRYGHLIVATGIELDFNQIKGMDEALKTEYVCSNYSPLTVLNTWKCMQKLEKGTALFTLPTTAIKCPGAPQKIVYLTDDYLRMQGRRKNVKIIFNSSLPFIFGVEKYAKALQKVVERKEIEVNYLHNLVEVQAKERLAIFQNLTTHELIPFQYNMLHVTPPQVPSKMLGPIADQTGFVDVNKETLQHTKYSNIFALGDCTNLPTSKTLAAVAAQSHVLFQNLSSMMKGTELKAKYNGYTSCPLITTYHKCILAEFDYDKRPCETFPFDQSKERVSMFYLKKTLMPLLYWNLMRRGYWNGPAALKRLLRLGFK